MNLKDMVINALVEKHELNKRQAKEVMDTVFDTLIENIIQEDKVLINGLGTFVTKLRPERQGRNPQTQEPIKIPAKKVITFKPSTALKQMVNNKTEIKFKDNNIETNLDNSFDTEKQPAF